jgi:hypothetical protein
MLMTMVAAAAVVMLTMEVRTNTTAAMAVMMA